jgi:hypothetical protein
MYKVKIKYNKMQYLQGNGLVCQVKTSPEILLVYRAHIVMIVHKILTANTRWKGVKKFPELEHTVQIRTTTRAHDGSAPSSGAVFAGAFEQSAWARRW